MKNNLAPTYQYLFGEFWVLWYSASNSYSIVEPSFKTLIDYYIQSETLDSFTSKVFIEDEITDAKTIAKTISNYLKECNKTLKPKPNEQIVIDVSNRHILKQYEIKDKIIQIYFDSELVLKTVHPAIAHYSIKPKDNGQIVFDIYLKNEQLFLFKDEQLISCVPKKDYPLIQGKFIMQLLCSIHDKEENDWISTFHGSTITNGNESILFIGESGKGKSTLCALLCAHGFELLADDVSPMLSKDKYIYFNPSAISIKQGAFNLLQPIVPDFDDLPIVQFNKTKGLIKYLPNVNPKNDSYKCNTIILVNYKNKSETILETASVKTFLETLVVDSWISPHPFHAKQFLDWLSTLKIYKLTYSDTKSVTKKITQIFKQFN